MKKTTQELGSFSSVVPENTLSHIGGFVYHLADYQVFIVATNSLEPILLSLKKIEDYEFVDELSPEDRENICRILGKFAHLSKRRIQIDAFFIANLWNSPQMRDPFAGRNT